MPGFQFACMGLLGPEQGDQRNYSQHAVHPGGSLPTSGRASGEIVLREASRTVTTTAGSSCAPAAKPAKVNPGTREPAMARMSSSFLSWEGISSVSLPPRGFRDSPHSRKIRAQY